MHWQSLGTLLVCTPSLTGVNADCWQPGSRASEARPGAWAPSLPFQVSTANYLSQPCSTVAPGETVQSQISCTPVRLGLRKVIVKLSSQQVKEVHAEKVVLVTP